MRSLLGLDLDFVDAYRALPTATGKQPAPKMISNHMVIIRQWVGHVDQEILRHYTHIADAASPAAMQRLSEASQQLLQQRETKDGPKNSGFEVSATSAQTREAKNAESAN